MWLEWRNTGEFFLLPAYAMGLTFTHPLPVGRSGISPCGSTAAQLMLSASLHLTYTSSSLRVL